MVFYICVEESLHPDLFLCSVIFIIFTIYVLFFYISVLFQIVVCQNRATRKGLIQAVLTHEMIHMFDYCRHKLDFRNKQHLACTEIRAANLTHCSFISAMIQGDVYPHNIKEKHQASTYII